jgi:hypothetical protein
MSQQNGSRGKRRCASVRSLQAAAVVAVVLACAFSAPPALAAPSTAGQTWVAYPKLLAQVRSGPLIRAIINPTRMDVEIKFRNLDEWHAYYPPGAQRQLQRLLRTRDVHVIFVPRPPAATASTAGGGHPLRWALAGGALLALLTGGAVLLFRRARADR